MASFLTEFLRVALYEVWKPRGCYCKRWARQRIGLVRPFHKCIHSIETVPFSLPEQAQRTAYRTMAKKRLDRRVPIRVLSDSLNCWRNGGAKLWGYRTAKCDLGTENDYECIWRCSAGHIKLAVRKQSGCLEFAKRWGRLELHKVHWSLRHLDRQWEGLSGSQTADRSKRLQHEAYHRVVPKECTLRDAQRCCET